MLRFCVAVAGSYSSKWTPSLGTSYAMGKVLKRQKKKKKKKKQRCGGTPRWPPGSPPTLQCPHHGPLLCVAWAGMGISDPMTTDKEAGNKRCAPGTGARGGAGPSVTLQSHYRA